MKVLGMCPVCGQEIAIGKYGAYCINKCGFKISNFRGVELTESQIEHLLGGDEVLIENIPKKDDSRQRYKLYIKMNGVKPVAYNGRDYYYPQYINRFPERGE